MERRKQKPPCDATSAEIEIQHDHALALQNMEKSRKDLYDAARLGFRTMGFEDFWSTQREIYCDGNSGAKYIDLDGVQHTCQ